MGGVPSVGSISGMIASPAADVDDMDAAPLHAWGRTFNAMAAPPRQRLGRRRSAFLPPGFANQFETDHDHVVGVTFQKGYEGVSSYQPPKVLDYDAPRLFRGLTAWKALWTATRAATATSGLAARVAGFSLVAVGFLLLAPASGANSLAAIEALNAILATGLLFILGPYVGVAVSRWWSVRRDGIGSLWGAVDDLAV